jgi:hypothetical protein
MLVRNKFLLVILRGNFICYSEKKSSQNFSAEMGFYKIDPCSKSVRKFEGVAPPVAIVVVFASRGAGVPVGGEGLIRRALGVRFSPARVG